MKKSLNEMKKPQRKRKRQAIVEAAIEIFMRDGFGQASMDEIAQQALVSKRTVYDHFGNKENLFQTILIEHWNSVFEINQPLFDSSKDIHESLWDFAKKFMNFIYQSKTINLFRLLISESNRFPNLLNAILIDDKAPFTRKLINYLDTQKKIGKLKTKNTEIAAAFFMGMLKEAHFWPMMLGFTKLKQPKNQSQLIKEAIDVFIKSYT